MSDQVNRCYRLRRRPQGAVTDGDLEFVHEPVLKTAPGQAWPGQFEVMQLVMSRASIRGFLVFDHVDRFPEAIEHLAGLMAQGKLKYEETVVDGLERASDAVNALFDGTNTGKLLVKVAEPAPNPAAQQQDAGVASAA